MIPERGKQTVWTVLGLTAGVATGVWLWRRRSAREQPRRGEWAPPRGAGGEVAEALRRDRTLARRSIEADAIADGVVELTGRVGSREEARRAVRLAQGAGGVYTVVNRLVIEDEENHREETRRRREEGAPELNDRGHSGMGVGMGTRRQSPDTDPDRPSDKQKMLDRELEVGNVEDTPGGGLDPVSGAEAVESTPVKPGDERAMEEAGLDAEPRPTSTPKESVPSGETGPESVEEPAEESEESEPQT